MVWERIQAWLDNPIFVKHLRSRLRVQPLLSAIVVVQALCLCIAWAGFQLNSFANGSAFGALVLADHHHRGDRRGAGGDGRRRAHGLPASSIFTASRHFLATS